MYGTNTAESHYDPDDYEAENDYTFEAENESDGEYAVVPPPRLLDILEGYDLQALAMDRAYQELRTLTLGFVDSCLIAMGQLPPSPGRGVTVTDERINKLRALVMPIRKSFLVAYAAIKVLSRARLCQTRPGSELDPKKSREKIAEAMAHYFRSEGQFLNYQALASWLWRRSPSGAKSTRTYEAEKRKRTPAAYAAQKRIRYYAAKGLEVPPKRKYVRRAKAAKETAK